MPKTIKIAYLIDTISSDKAGTEKQLLNIIRRLDPAGFEVTLICLYDSPWMYENSLPCRWVSLGYRGFLKPGFPLVLRRYLQVLHEGRFDIVQTFFEDAIFLGCLGKLLSRSRHSLVLSRRDLGLGADEPGYHRLYRRALPLVLKLVDGISTNAVAIKRHLVETHHVDAGLIKVIPNGLEIPDLPQNVPPLFREFRASLWIGIVANLKPVKRVDLFLRALAHLRASGCREDFRAVILGEGRLRGDLVQLCEQLGIADRVHFLGAREDVSAYLHGLDIGVLCSDNEGLSNAILEYMACGLPVVATAVGGNCELVDETNGGCVPAGDHVALGQALSRLAASPELRRTLGERSFERVRTGATWDRIMPQWESYYRSLRHVSSEVFNF